MQKLKRGILLAGGQGSRLSPISKIYNKHLMPIYDKPMIYFPLYTLMQANITEVLIISNSESLKFFKKLFENGKRLGIKIEYGIQNRPLGLPNAIQIAKKFIQKESFCVNLGDHILCQGGIENKLISTFSNFEKSTIFIKENSSTKEFGELRYNKKGKPLIIVEKPNKTISKKIVTGLYTYTNDVFEKIKSLKPSKRNEFEISDLNNLYLKNKAMNVIELNKKTFWCDAGDFNRLNYLSNKFKKQRDIGCIEYLALKKKLINEKTYFRNIDFFNSSNYSSFLESKLK